MERGLATAFTGLARRRHRNQTLVIAYHNIVPEGQAARGDSSLHLPQAAFAAQLDLLAATHRILPLSEVFSDVTSELPRVAITFDDACQGAVTAGVQELEKRGIPATVFVPPGLLGQTFWWDVLAPNEGGELSSDVRAYALDQLAGKGSDIRAWAIEKGWRLHAVPVHQQAATEAMLDAMTRSGLVTLGSHTWSHPNLARLEQGELRDELLRPLDWLRARFPATVPWIAYPYGLTSPAVARAAAESGYVGGFLIEGGWLKAGGDHFRLARLNIPAGLSLRGFELRVVGLVK